MNTNKLEMIGHIENVSEPLDLLLGEQEIRQIEFELTADCGLSLDATARTDTGTAFYALLHDKNFGEGCVCRAVGYLLSYDGSYPKFVTETLQRGTSHQNLVIDSISLTLEQLKDKAQSNLYMGKAALFKLLDNFTEGSPQHYAIACQLRRQHQDRSEATEIALWDAVCAACKTEMHVDIRYAYRFGKARCNDCGKNQPFNLVQPIPREPQAPPPSLEEVQRRLKERFGS